MWIRVNGYFEQVNKTLYHLIFRHLIRNPTVKYRYSCQTTNKFFFYSFILHSMADAESSQGAGDETNRIKESDEAKEKANMAFKSKARS